MKKPIAALLALVICCLPMLSLGTIISHAPQQTSCHHAKADQAPAAPAKECAQICKSVADTLPLPASPSTPAPAFFVIAQVDYRPWAYSTPKTATPSNYFCWKDPPLSRPDQLLL